MIREEKAELITAARSFVETFAKLPRSQEIRGRMSRIGAAICRALAYRLRYQGPGSLTASAYESIVATALIDQRVFDVAQRVDEDPIQLLKTTSLKVQQIVSEALKLSSEHALYLLEHCIMMFELSQPEELLGHGVGD